MQLPTLRFANFNLELANHDALFALPFALFKDPQTAAVTDAFVMKFESGSKGGRGQESEQ